MRVVLADRNSRRLIFSIKQKEKEELVEKKKSLMVRNSWSSLLGPSTSLSCSHVHQTDFEDFV